MQATRHPGRCRTLELLSWLYWWPSMMAFVSKYVSGCDTCQWSKPAQHPWSILQPHDMPEGPWQMIGVDLITGLPWVNNYDVIAVYIDHYSKQVHIIPTTSNVDAEGMVDIYYQEIFWLHGVPTKIISNCGPQFVARLMKALYSKLGITHALTTMYHPQSNGQTEQANQEVECHLWLFTNSRHNDWVTHIPTAKFVLNSHLHSAHQMTPFKIMYGYRPDFTVLGSPLTKFPALDSHLHGLCDTCKNAKAALQMEKHIMKQTFEANKPPPHAFSPGQKVWLSSKNILISHSSRKLAPWQLSLYNVLQCTGKLTYHLRLLPGMHQYPVFHIDHLSPWHSNDINGSDPPPPPLVQVDNVLEYEVKCILDSHKYHSQYQYLIKWEGYNAGHNSWEPATHLTHCPDLIQAFHAAHPSAPHHLSASLFTSLPWCPH